MNRSESWKTWIVVAGLLIFAGIASATIPFLIDQLNNSDEPSTSRETHPTVTTIDVSELPFIGEVLVEIPFIAENIQGLSITLLQAFGVIFGVVLVTVGAFGVLITLLVFIPSRWINNVYADKGYQEAQTELEERQKASLKNLQQEQPLAEPVEAERRIRWSAVTFGLIVVVLVWVTSVLLAFGLFQNETISIGGFDISAVAFLSLVSVVVTIIVLYLALRRRDPTELETAESDNKPVNWGAIWVIVTGLLVVGIGTGLAIAFTSP
ncbi:MAG: hypothetical protein AMJ56_01590 [Anaerolineae bacterium SG8_19]|nr:MAG: hypothetical protein AMJ56_01590 [Anaerolineae bacterium SG8_19]